MAWLTEIWLTKHLILLKIVNMMRMKEVLLKRLMYLLIKKLLVVILKMKICQTKS